MIITRRFVFIHLPKSAGMWAHKAIEQAHLNLFFRKTPLGEILFNIGKFLPFAFARQTIYKIARRLIIFNYRYYDIGNLSIKNYHDPLGSSKLKWFIFFAQGMHLLDVKYETMLRLQRHTRYAQLPEFFQEMPILAAMRDPFSWHVSRYNYYKEQESKQLIGSGNSAQSFINILGDDINFEQYCSNKMMKLQNYFYQGYNNYIKKQKDGEEVPQYHNELIDFYNPTDNNCPPAKHYGLMTLRFIQIFFKRPLDVMNLPPAEFEQYFIDGKYKDNLKNITFLQQDKINQQLYDYMIKLRYEAQDLQHIKDLPPENVSTDKPYKSFYTSKDMVDKIYKLERAIFIMFPQYEEVYKLYK